MEKETKKVKDLTYLLQKIIAMEDVLKDKCEDKETLHLFVDSLLADINEMLEQK